MKFLSFLRSSLMAILYPVMLVFMSGLAMFQAAIFKNKEWENRIVQTWGWLSYRMFGVSVVEHGRENLKWGGCVYLFNHSSFFDIFVMHAHIRGVRFGAKIELFSIPVLARAMKVIGVLPIVRENRANVMRVYEDAKARAQRGEQFALAPEGKRNTESGLLPFKTGPFVFAINAQIPIVPVVIKGASEVFQKGALLPNWDQWHRQIEIHYLPRVEVAGLTYTDRQLLMEKVHQMMEPYFVEKSQYVMGDWPIKADADSL